MAGIASGVSTLAVAAAERRRRTSQGQSTPNTNTNTSTSSKPYEEFSYSDSAKQNIEGLTNQTDLQQKQINALKGLVGVLNGMDENEPENGTPSNPHDYPTPVPPRNRSSGKYNNTGDQKIKGLSNQTGCIEGNANGAINLGDLRM